MKLEVEDGGHFSLDGASVMVLHIYPAVICEVGSTGQHHHRKLVKQQPSKSPE